MWQVVDSGAVIHDVFGCLFSNCVFSTDGVYSVTYFLQPVLERRKVATSQMTYHSLLSSLLSGLEKAIELECSTKHLQEILHCRQVNLETADVAGHCSECI